MELIRINEVVGMFGISSRTLRYYEQVGILYSIHPDNKSQRYYNTAALERLKQIIILRKLQIPIKNIVSIYKNESTATLIKTFADKLESLDTEISALSELRRLIDEFLQKMMMSGIKKISAITLLYEETQKRLATVEKDEEITFEELSKISREALRLHDIRIIRLPPMRVLTSRQKTGKAVNLGEVEMQSLFSGYSFVPVPGMRDCFMRKEQGDEWVMLIKIPEGYDNKTIFIDETLPGGLYAVVSAFFESMDDTFVLLREWVNNSDDFGLDKKRFEMLEEIMPWDIANMFNRYQQDVFIPIQLKT